VGGDNAFLICSLNERIYLVGDYCLVSAAKKPLHSTLQSVYTLLMSSVAIQRPSKQGLLPGKVQHPATKTANSGGTKVFYGVRYLDPKTSRWISADPAMGEYIPQAPINDEAKKNNKNLPGMGGVFNYVNFHVYHYAGNNPIVMRDPDGKEVVAIFTVTELKLTFFGIRASGYLTITDNDTGDFIMVKAYSGGSAVFANSSLPLPRGEYDILQKTPRNGYRLELRDSNYGDDSVSGVLPEQGLLRLHGPGRTFGCLAIESPDSYSKVEEFLNRTTTSNVEVNSKGWRGIKGFFGVKETQKKMGTLTVTTVVKDGFFIRHKKIDEL